MPTFLKLTYAPGDLTALGTHCWVNMSKIISFDQDKDTGHTVLATVIDNYFIYVQETPEEIIRMLALKTMKPE